MIGALLKKNLLVFAGAGLGGLARYAAGLLADSLAPGPFPWGTFAVNVTGCFAMGGLMYLFKDRGLLAPGHRLFLMVGLLGGYTTFSSFGYESDALMRRGYPALETLYVAASVLSAVAAIWAGRFSTQGIERLTLAARRAASPTIPRAMPLEEELSE